MTPETQTCDWPPCDRTARLGAYVDGELDAAARRNFDLHLAGCAACSAELESLRGLGEWFRQDATSGPRLAAISLARLHRTVDGWADQGLVRIARYLSAVAASILLLGSAWLIESRAPGPRPLAAWEPTAVAYQPEPAGGGGAAAALDTSTEEWIVADLSHGAQAAWVGDR